MHRITRTALTLGVCAALGSACAPTPELTDADRLVIAAAVDSATRSFQRAERARNAEQTVAHLAPDFYIYIDGVRTSYDDVAAMIRQSMPLLATFEPTWDDLEIKVLGRNAAVASFVFRDSIVTTTGDMTLTTGPTTLVWERRGQDWLIVYGDADHYPVP